MKLNITIRAGGSSGFAIYDPDGAFLAGCSSIGDVCAWLQDQCADAPVNGEVLVPDDGKYPRVVASQAETKREEKRGWLRGG